MSLLRSDIINNEFIIQALRFHERTKHVELDSISTGFPEEGGLQDILPLQVIARIRGKPITYEWTAKIAPRSETVGTAGLVLGLWEKEIQIFRELLPYYEYAGKTCGLLVPVHPTLIYSTLDLDKECLILSSIEELGFESVSPDITDTQLSVSHVMLAMEWLAKFHALGYHYCNSQHNRKWLEDKVPYAGRSNEGLLHLIRSKNTNNEVLVEYASRLETLFSSSAYADICRDIFSPRKEHFSTVCHGRPSWQKLMIWKSDDVPMEAIFNNFEEARICQPATDLAILLYTSTSRAFRKEHLSTVLKRYHAELTDCFLQLGISIDVYPFSQLFEDYQDAVVPAVGVAVNLIPGLIGTGDETDSNTNIQSDRSLAVLGDIVEDLEELGKI